MDLTRSAAQIGHLCFAQTGHHRFALTRFAGQKPSTEPGQLQLVPPEV